MINDRLSQAAHAIDASFEQSGCSAAFHVVDLATGAEIGVGSDSPVVLASVFKVFIALEFYAQVAAGALDPVRRLELVPGSLTAGPSGTSIFEDRATISLRDLCRLMMSISDNAATDLLLAEVGRDQVNARLQKCGCLDTVIACDLATMFDELAAEIGFPNYAQLAAARSGKLGEDALKRSQDPSLIDRSSAFDPIRTNRSTPRDMTRLLKAIWKDEAAPPEACASARAVMGQQVGGRLVRHLPDGAVVAGKTGSLTGRVRNEVGVITHADGQSFAVAVFTRAHAPFVQIARIENEIGKAAATAIAALSGPD